jgi:hypothetical protein
MAQGIQSPEGIVYGVRKPGEGMPVRGMECCEHPPHRLRPERLDIRIFVHIPVIIPVDKIVLEYRKKYKDSEYCNSKGCYIGFFADFKLQGNIALKLQAIIPYFYTLTEVFRILTDILWKNYTYCQFPVFFVYLTDS